MKKVYSNIKVTDKRAGMLVWESNIFNNRVDESLCYLYLVEEDKLKYPNLVDGIFEYIVLGEDVTYLGKLTGNVNVTDTAINNIVDTYKEALDEMRLEDDDYNYGFMHGMKYVLEELEIEVKELDDIE